MDQLTLWSFILMRMSGFILLNPILGRRNIPNYVKAGFIFVLSVFTITTYPMEVVEPINSLEFGLRLMTEFGIGYIVSYVMNLFIYIILYAGGIMDFHMGISIATIYDANTNASLPITSTLYNILFVLLFFAVDGHLTLIRIILTSGEIIPYGAGIISATISQEVLNMFVQCTVLAIKLAFPIIAVEFLIELGVGVLMKTIPQINVFVVNIQTKLLVGIAMLVILFNPMADFISSVIVTMLQSVKDILTLMS